MEPVSVPGDSGDSDIGEAGSPGREVDAGTSRDLKTEPGSDSDPEVFRPNDLIDTDEELLLIIFSIFLIHCTYPSSVLRFTMFLFFNNVVL